MKKVIIRLCKFVTAVKATSLLSALLTAHSHSLCLLLTLSHSHSPFFFWGVQELHNELKDLEQETVVKESLDVVAKDLVSSQVMGNSEDKSVKILASCCLADILRLYAPEAPYDNSIIKVCRLSSRFCMLPYGHLFFLFFFPFPFFFPFFFPFSSVSPSLGHVRTVCAAAAWNR